MADDTLRILTAMQERWRGRLTTVFRPQGHYALDHNDICTYPTADIIVDSISDLVRYDVAAFLDAALGRCNVS
jgi:hypothetical protein